MGSRAEATLRGRVSCIGGMFMNTSGITAALPAQDLNRAKNFYSERVGLEALESHLLEASDGQVG